MKTKPKTFNWISVADLVREPLEEQVEVDNVVVEEVKKHTMRISTENDEFIVCIEDLLPGTDVKEVGDVGTIVLPFMRAYQLGLIGDI